MTFSKSTKTPIFKHELLVKSLQMLHLSCDLPCQARCLPEVWFGTPTPSAGHRFPEKATKRDFLAELR